MVKGTRRVRLSLATKSRPAVKRLGKIRGASVDALEAVGGEDTVQNLCRVLHRSRPRDLVRFKASEKGHDGPLVMLLEAGIVQWVSDVETRREILRLAPDWLERLEEARQLAGEADCEVLSGRLADDGRLSLARRKGAATLQRERQERNSRAWRLREEDPPGAHWANVPDADGAIEELRPADEPERREAEESPVSPLAAAVRDYLERNTRDADQPPGWIGATLWAYDLYPGKPGPGEVRAAIAELGGDTYLRGRLRAAKGEAA